MDAPLYGALDLGTNNCRLLMATPAAGGFRVVDAFSRITRLGEGLAHSGALSPVAIDRTVAALKQCSRRLTRRGAERVRAVATAACRQATNCTAFLSRVHAETGLEVEIISAEEEASLALAGCAALLDHHQPHALVFDIGGGSTELLRVRMLGPAKPEIEAVASLPIGVVTLAERCGDYLYSSRGYAETVDSVTSMLQPFDRDGSLRHLAAAGRLQMLGTSGTVTTLAGLHLNLARYDRAAVDGLMLNFADIDRITRELVAATAEERRAHPCIGCQRADLVVAGCAILEAICRLWPAGTLRVADRGVREGMLLSMMQADRRVSAR
jgi:exopolyphosphatase / guanosine-5'-triphosphate,3'-diphosphate pyrophosphatase